MSDRFSRPEPFALARARESFADWFASPARLTVPSNPIIFFEEPMIVVRGKDEAHPVGAGAIAGALGGAAMLGVATLLAARLHGVTHLPTLIGSLASRGHAAGATAPTLGWIVSLLVGALIGGAYGWMTRRLRQLPALIGFGIVLASSTWMVVHTLALPRVAPWLAKMLPIGPMMVGATVFGIVLSLQLPLRTRKLL